MKYAKDVMVATLKNVFHNSGVLWQRRFEPIPEPGAAANAHYDLKLGYSSSHQWALDACLRARRSSTSEQVPAASRPN